MNEPAAGVSIQGHNVRYLPLVYFLPRELVSKCPTLCQLPRKFSEIARSESWLDLIESDAFLHEIMDASAALAFPHFGFPGWKEHYTGHFPVWRLSYAMPLWAKGIERETGWGLQMLFNLPRDALIPFFAPEYVEAVFERVVKRTISEQGWQPVLDVIREIPCEEDFEDWNTNVRRSFIRRWYHTRSKKVQSVSLEAILEEGESGLWQVPDVTKNVEEAVAAQDYVKRFFVRLSERDRAILQLRMDGFTYLQIAERLGYANHSGVIKRMQKIQKAFESYQHE